MPQDNDTITIEFKEYGVKLNFTPIVLEDSKIHLRLKPEVSEVDPTTTIRTADIDIPAFITRKATTVVELRDGQSFAIAGLLQSTNRKLQSQVPWLGQIPVLGALFRSSSYIKNETDLVIIVTPRLVRPAGPGQQVATPFDKTRPANDPEFFLLGQLEVTKDMIRTLRARQRRGRALRPHARRLHKDKMVYVKKNRLLLPLVAAAGLVVGLRRLSQPLRYGDARGRRRAEAEHAAAHRRSVQSGSRRTPRSAPTAARAADAVTDTRPRSSRARRRRRTSR